MGVDDKIYNVDIYLPVDKSIAALDVEPFDDTGHFGRYNTNITLYN